MKCEAPFQMLVLSADKIMMPIVALTTDIEIISPREKREKSALMRIPCAI